MSCEKGLPRYALGRQPWKTEGKRPSERLYKTRCVPRETLQNLYKERVLTAKKFYRVFFSASGGGIGPLTGMAALASARLTALVSALAFASALALALAPRGAVGCCLLLQPVEFLFLFH